MRRFRPFFCSVFLLCSCDPKYEVSQIFDFSLFSVFGHTPFSNSMFLNSRELHFDTARHVGKVIKISGNVREKGEHNSHFILDDEFGRVLVVTVSASTSDSLGSLKENGSVEVLGVVEVGKKGLPFLFAKVLRSTGSTI